MGHNEWRSDDSVYACQGRLTAVVLLATLLTCIFFLAMGAYGYYAAMDEGGLSGNLPDAVMALRSFVEENDAVAVFLGLAPDEAIETMGKPDTKAHILEAAEAYIREKQG